MNSRMMRAYVEYVADFLLKMLGFKPLYRTENPVRRCRRLALRFLPLICLQFPFMEASAISVKANFFERPVSDYLGVGASRLL